MASAKEVFSVIKKKGLTNTVCDLIIRPPRSAYTMQSLGPEFFRLGDDSPRFQRVDLVLHNMRGMAIQCSWFKHAGAAGGEPPVALPCVVYCHANCGGRRDGLEILFLLRRGFTVFTFDFCGSGHSDGEYISLGFYERQDLAAVVEYLQLRPREVDGIGLWGRSMGAVTSVMYAARDDSIRFLVLDSPFSTLRGLIADLVVQHGGSVGRHLPTALVNTIVGRIRGRIARRAGFDIDDLDTLKYARLCRVPGLILHGAEDDFVRPVHSLAVRDAFAASCLHVLVDGDHNDERDDAADDMAALQLQLYVVEKPRAERERQQQQQQQQQYQEGGRGEETTTIGEAGQSNSNRASPSSPVSAAASTSTSTRTAGGGVGSANGRSGSHSPRPQQQQHQRGPSSPPRITAIDRTSARPARDYSEPWEKTQRKTQPAAAASRTSTQPTTTAVVTTTTDGSAVTSGGSGGGAGERYAPVVPKSRYRGSPPETLLSVDGSSGSYMNRDSNNNSNNGGYDSSSNRAIKHRSKGSDAHREPYYDNDDYNYNNSSSSRQGRGESETAAGPTATGITAADSCTDTAALLPAEEDEETVEVDSELETALKPISFRQPNMSPAL